MSYFLIVRVNVIMLCVVTLNVIKLSVIMLNVIMLSVVAPLFHLKAEGEKLVLKILIE